MAIYQVFTEKKKSFFEKISITIWLIILNVFLFLLFSLLISSGIISIDLIAFKPSNILQGKFLWTLFTSIFMHAGFFHLFANMLSLLFVGNLLEKILGRKRYLHLYLLAGIFSGILFVLSSQIFPSDLNSYAVGASGALFGLIGVLMFLTPNLPVYLMFVPIPIKMKYVAPGMLVLLWLISIGADIPIGNIAHLGGLIVGVIYGIYLRKVFPNKVKVLSKRFS